MARAALSVTRLTEAGIDPTAVDAAVNTADGNSFPWAEHRVFMLLNGDDAAVTPTFLTSGTVGRSSLPIGDLAGAAVAAAGYRIYGPFGQEFRQADGSVYVDYAGTTPTNITAVVFDA